MAIKSYKPTTPSRRHMTVSAFDGIDKKAKPERSQDDLKIEYDRFLLAEVAQSMDNYLTIYAYLSDSLMELSEDPSNSQLQEKLTGALEGIYVAKVGNSGMEWQLFEAYSNNHQELCSVMQDVSLS